MMTQNEPTRVCVKLERDDELARALSYRIILPFIGIDLEAREM